MTADFNIDTDGTLTVGDITVTGGYMSADGSPVVLDNFGTLGTWLNLTGTTITVGNVDYSDYESTASDYDVSAWKGAANIFAAQDDTTITDNVTKNVITLGNGPDTVNILAGATTDETSAAAIDQIIGFTHGDDLIQIDNATGAGGSVRLQDSRPDRLRLLPHVGKRGLGR